MTNHKHTPGPWTVHGVVQNTGSISICAGQLGIADVTNAVSVIDQVLGKPPKAQMANAQLIAAAPNMLADLIEAAATLRRYEANHRAKCTDDSLKKADVNAELASRFEQTIAKATA